MSIAGIRSNRGDIYQTLVAFDWSLTVLSDKNFQWLEIDSIAYSVDDIVVSKENGTLIASQCKKNQNDFKAWSITDLADEISKACHFLFNNIDAEVRFYSRNNFGALAKLREHSATQNDAVSYRTSLGKEHHSTDVALSSQIATSGFAISSFEFLRRTKFVTTDEFDRMEAILRERLRGLVSNPDSAFNALWARLDQLAARVSGDSASSATHHRLTKDDLKAILRDAGAMLVPPMNLNAIRQSFSKTSAIGRLWRRDIAGQRIDNPLIDKLLIAIDAKKKAILLTGLPGSGKTCAMLALQEALEARAKSGSNSVPLFVQSREFADLVTSQDRQSRRLPGGGVVAHAWMSTTARAPAISGGPNEYRTTSFRRWMLMPSASSTARTCPARAP